MHPQAACKHRFQRLQAACVCVCGHLTIFLKALESSHTRSCDAKHLIRWVVIAMDFVAVAISRANP